MGSNPEIWFIIFGEKKQDKPVQKASQYRRSIKQGTARKEKNGELNKKEREAQKNTGKITLRQGELQKTKCCREYFFIEKIIHIHGNKECKD